MENGDIADTQLNSTPQLVYGADNCRKEHSRLNFANASCNAFEPEEETTNGIY